MKKVDIDEIIDGWLERGVVSNERAVVMKAEVTALAAERSGSYFINAVMYIGASALALGALLFVASNWEGLTKEVKIILTLLLPIIPLSYAYYRQTVGQGFRVLAQAANVLGVALIGGSIAMIGQIYHLTANLQGFFWLWVLLSTPFLFVFRRPLNVLFAATLTGTAIFVSLFEYFDQTQIDDGLLLIFTTLVALGYAALLYAIGSLLRPLALWTTGGRFLRIGAGLLALVALFVTTFDEYAQVVIGSNYYEPKGWEGLAIVLNLTFIGFLVMMLWRAVRFEEYGFAFTVVRLFGLYLLVKYVTLFYDMMNTGLFFMFGGVIFIAGGWLLERKRSAILSYFQNAG